MRFRYLAKVAFGYQYTPYEQAVFDWHVANLEYGNATDLNHVSLCYWDQDDGFDFSGKHCMLPKGYSSLVEALAVRGMHSPSLVLTREHVIFAFFCLSFFSQLC